MIRRISINTDSVRSLELGVSEETVKKFDESSEDNFKLWPEMILLMKIAAPAVGAYVFPKSIRYTTYSSPTNKQNKHNPILYAYRQNFCNHRNVTTDRKVCPLVPISQKKLLDKKSDVRCFHKQ